MNGICLCLAPMLETNCITTSAAEVVCFWFRAPKQSLPPLSGICLCKVSMLETNSAASARPRGVWEKQTDLQTRLLSLFVDGFEPKNKLGHIWAEFVCVSGFFAKHKFTYKPDGGVCLFTVSGPKANSATCGRNVFVQHFLAKHKLHTGNCLLRVSTLETNSAASARPHEGTKGEEKKEAEKQTNVQTRELSLFVSGFGHQNKLGNLWAKFVCAGLRCWKLTVRHLRGRTGGGEQTNLQTLRRNWFVSGFGFQNKLGHLCA